MAAARVLVFCSRLQGHLAGEVQTGSVLSRLDALPDLEQLDDPRIVPFMVNVLADQRGRRRPNHHSAVHARGGEMDPVGRRIDHPPPSKR
jgi:hypothetical protein